MIQSFHVPDDFLKHSDGLLRAFFGDAEWSEHSNQVTLVSSLAEQHAGLSSLLEDMSQGLQVRLFLDLVLDELDSDEHALAPHVSQNGTVLRDASELTLQVCSYFLGPLCEILLLEDVEHIHADPALQRPSGEGGEVVVGQSIRDFSPGGHCGEGSAVGDGLSHDYDVGFDLLPLEAPRFLAYPAEAGLHFIGNVEPAHFFYQFVQRLHV